MAQTPEERKQKQYEYNQSEKGKARNRKWESQNPNGIKYRQEYRDKNRDYFIEYNKKYRETEGYKNSIKKYQSSEKYQSRLTTAYKFYGEMVTEFLDDGNNNEIEPIEIEPIQENEDNTMKNIFTDEFINSLCDEWIEWLESATYLNSSSCVVFRKEIPRSNYFQFLIHYKQKNGVRVSLADLEKEFLKNELLRDRLYEIDLMYEQLLEMYMTSGKINAIASKFMFTNKYRDKWQDISHKNTTTTIEKIVWNENLYIDAQVVEDKQLPPSPPKLTESNEDFDFEDL
ncbi:hypothetical protein [Paenimyroides baculatum]|uniref:Uncharacterized protein n=1 Tax=Paenimyroides baculatum TaxID=2608000 RepID=A0A5M6CH14_9FLAO|nr:hypothetical protein [Paenimyroides baculatum]KAA5534317.1 hypothetical protein F0460_09420 [Paenimyroides baculatum]